MRPFRRDPAEWDGGAAGGKIRHHLRRDGGRIGRDPLRDDAVIAGEHQHVDAREGLGRLDVGALITDLAQLRNVTVISRTSVMPYKRTSKSLPQIARELGVDGVVEGGVLRAGGRVRVTAQLIHAPTDHQLWASSYERDESDVGTLQREIATSITEALRAELSPEARARLHTAAQIDPVAYGFFLDGMAAAGRENTEDSPEGLRICRRPSKRQPDRPAYGDGALLLAVRVELSDGTAEFMGKASCRNQSARARS